jgi:3-hydroxyacyl-[acyl-carrier-protein] dehydratase
VNLTLPLDREAIEEILPHRPPFLLIDEVLELEPGKRVLARREVRADDWWFAGHFPGRPVMPGVLTIEAIAQAGAVAVLADEANRGKLPFFAGIDDCKFKRIVEPGDVLSLECEFVRVRGPVAKGDGVARVGDEIAAQAALTVFVGDAGR